MATERERAERERAAALVETIVDQVGDWPHVTRGEHRFGGTEFRVGSREIGHVHGWGMLDVPYPRKLRDALVEEGHTGPHHLLTESGWTTFHVESEADLDRARWLLRLSYLSHVAAQRRTPAGAAELDDVDVESELDALEPSAAVHEAFERR